MGEMGQGFKVEGFDPDEHGSWAISDAQLALTRKQVPLSPEATQNNDHIGPDLLSKHAATMPPEKGEQ
jgi:hypothetical protein